MEWIRAVEAKSFRLPAVPPAESVLSRWRFTLCVLTAGTVPAAQAGWAEQGRSDKMPNAPDSSSFSAYNPEDQAGIALTVKPRRIVRVRTRDLPYERIAHRRPVTMEYEIVKASWQRWRGRYVE